MPSLVGRRVAEILKRRTDVFCAAIYEGFLMKGLGNIWFLTPSPMTCRAFKFTKHWLPPAIFLQTVYCCVSQCFLDVSALAGVLCPPLWSCLFVVSGLVSHLGWDAASASLVLSGLVSHLLCLRLWPWGGEVKAMLRNRIQCKEKLKPPSNEKSESM